MKWRVSPGFKIKLHVKDIAALKEIQNTLGIGKVRILGIDEADYVAESFKELQIIVDHFDKYPLATVKKSDYLIFKQCFDMILKREHLTEEGLLKIVALKTNLNWGLS